MTELPSDLPDYWPGECPHGFNTLLVRCPSCERDRRDLEERQLMRQVLERALVLLERMEQKL